MSVNIFFSDVLLNGISISLVKYRKVLYIMINILG